MNEPKDSDQLASWHALQVELGLVPTNEAAPRSQAKPSATPPSISEEIPPPAPPPMARLAPPAEEMPEVTEEVPAFEEVPTAEIPAETNEGPVDHPVEVGEAPEEVESEPAPEEEKRRGRRRGRRRRGRKPSGEAVVDGQASGAIAQPAAEAGSPADSGEAGSRNLAEDDDDMEGTDSTPLLEDEDEEEEVEPMSFADFNVPTWQELIASLYRPER